MSFLILQGDARQIPLRDESVHCCITSPPYYGLRSYLSADHKDKALEIGLESSLDAYVSQLVAVFRDVWRVLHPSGCVFLNLGDSYARPPEKGGSGTYNGRNGYGNEYSGQKPLSGLAPKNLCMVPARVALALQADGWWLRQEITWAKLAPMPESVTDRFTSATEKIFLLTKQPRYYFDAEAVKEQAEGTSGWAKQRERGVNTWQYNNTSERIASTGQRIEASTFGTVGTRQMRNFWLLGPEPTNFQHFATMPTEIVKRCVLAGSSEKGCCPACGSPWVRVVEREGGREWRNDRMVSKGIPGELAGSSSYKRGQSQEPLNNTQHVKTLGWQPSCACPPHTPVPCVVFDPFSGAGTSALVADRLGRHGIGMDLSWDYCQLAHRRTADDAPLFNSLMSVAPPVTPALQAGLFGEE